VQITQRKHRAICMRGMASDRVPGIRNERLGVPPRSFGRVPGPPRLVGQGLAVGVRVANPLLLLQSRWWEEKRKGKEEGAELRSKISRATKRPEQSLVLEAIPAVWPSGFFQTWQEKPGGLGRGMGAREGGRRPWPSQRAFEPQSVSEAATCSGDESCPGAPPSEQQRCEYAAGSFLVTLKTVFKKKKIKKKKSKPYNNKKYSTSPPPPPVSTTQQTTKKGKIFHKPGRCHHRNRNQPHSEDPAAWEGDKMFSIDRCRESHC